VDNVEHAPVYVCLDQQGVWKTYEQSKLPILALYRYRHQFNI